MSQDYPICITYVSKKFHICPNIEEIEVINLADEDETKKPIKIGVNFPKDMKDELIALLKEFKEIFSWCYHDMPRLDTNIFVHKIPVKSECP